MKYNWLGKTGMKVSKLSFGASPFGNIYKTNVSQPDATNMIATAIEAGINYFDVAPYYGLGLAEEKLGLALPKNTDNLIISTKIGRYARNEFDFSIKRIRKSLATSMKKLNRDYIDIVICHDIEFIDHRQIMSSVIEFLLQLKKEGVIRAIGISAFPLDVLQEVATKLEIDVILSYCKYTLLDQSLLSLKPLINKKNIGLINASPFAMGLLTEHNCPDWHPFSKDKLKEVTELKKIATQQDVPVEKLALEFAQGCPISATTLTGFASMMELRNGLSWVT